METLILVAIAGIVTLCLLVLLMVAAIKVFFAVLALLLVVVGFIVLGLIVF
jgi:hypothetical protein